MGAAGPLKKRVAKRQRVFAISISAMFLTVGGVLAAVNDGWSLADRLFNQDAKPTPGAPGPALPGPSTPILAPPEPKIPTLAPLDPSTPTLAPPGPNAPTSAPPGPNTPTPAPPAPPPGRFLVDLDMKESDRAQSAPCTTTDGTTFAKSLVLSVPAEGGYARADYDVPHGFVNMTAIIGFVDGVRPDVPNPQVNVFIQIGYSSSMAYEEKIPYGKVSPISIPVTAGQRLRIQASAGGDGGGRLVCVGDARLNP